MGLYRCYSGTMEKKLESIIEGLGCRVECRPMINKPPPLKGLNIRIPTINPHEREGVYESRVWVRV